MLAKLISGDVKRTIRRGEEEAEIELDPLETIEAIRRLIASSGLLAYRAAKVRGDLIEKFEDLTKRPVSPADAFLQFFGPAVLKSAIADARKRLGKKAGPVIAALEKAASTRSR